MKTHRCGSDKRLLRSGQDVFKNGSRQRKEADFGAKRLPPRDLGGYGPCDDS